METLRPSAGDSLLWLVEWFEEEAPGALCNDCRLSRRVVPSSSQLVSHRPLKSSLLMMLVFTASTNCPTVGLPLEPQHKRIAPNMFSRGSWFRFQVWRCLKPASSTVLHMCWAAAMWKKRMKKGGFTILQGDTTIYLHTCPCPVIYKGTCYRWVWQCNVFPGSTCVPPLKLSKKLSTSSTNATVARYSLQHHPERKLKRKLVGFPTWWTTIFLQVGK
jgi:hypothetical protein